MQLKGFYSREIAYEKNDIILYQQDDVVYLCRKNAPAGTTPHDTRYWNRLDQYLADSVKLILQGVTDAEEAASEDVKKISDELDSYFVDDKTLVLASSTASSTKKFAITVDDEGEISADEIVEDEDDISADEIVEGE